VTDPSRYFYEIALTFLPKVGDVLAKNLISYCGNAEKVFKASKGKLLKIPGIGAKTVAAIQSAQVLERAEAELEFIGKNNIRLCSFYEKAYPLRLRSCADSPVVLYYKGSADLNAYRMVSVVGTRHATTYGKESCEKLIADLAKYKVLVVSGMAYGVDICAHRAALKHDIPTIAVLAHGLDRLYPGQHRETARQMVANGGLLTDYPSGTNPDKEHFPRRNRIIAGICEMLIVVETAKRGGSIITAELANGYNRDVFAVPGNINRQYSQGCNYLIKTNKAGLIDKVDEVAEVLGWPEKTAEAKPRQAETFVELSAQEKKVAGILQKQVTTSFDDLVLKTRLSSSEISNILLSLEFNGLVRSLPGKIYKWQ